MKTYSHFTDDQTAGFTVAIELHFVGIPVATVMSTCKVPDLQAALGDLNNCTLPIMGKGKAESIAHFPPHLGIFPYTMMLYTRFSNHPPSPHCSRTQTI